MCGRRRLPSTSGSPPHPAHGHERRSMSNFKNDSFPSFQAIANSSPICWILTGSKRIGLKTRLKVLGQTRPPGALISACASHRLNRMELGDLIYIDKSNSLALAEYRSPDTDES